MNTLLFVMVFLSQNKMYLIDLSVAPSYSISWNIAQGSSSHKTKTGVFSIDRIVYNPKNKRLGIVWMPFKSKDFGIHGNLESSNPVTKGCIKMNNFDIYKLANYVRKGTKVIILE